MKDSSRRPRTPAKMAVLLFLGSTVIALVGLELAARVWVGIRWSPEDVADLTQPNGPRAGYEPAPGTGYHLQADYRREDNKGRTFTHDSLGFRGPEISREKPASTVRVVLMGASTVYGIFVDDEETSSVVLERILNAQPDLPRFEVINAGVPGWTSRETRINLERRIVGLAPDFVVLIDGRNDLFPEVFEDYDRDYSHYRKIPWRYEEANLSWKRFFRLSHLAMVLIGDNYEGVLGYARRNEDPVYGYIRYEHQPSEDEVETAAMDSTIFTGWRDNVRASVELALESGATPVIVEMPFRREAYGSGVLPLEDFSEAAQPRIREILTSIVARNNSIAADIAAGFHIPFVPTGPVISPDYLVDDCHFNPAGEEKIAAIIAEAIRSSWLADNPTRVSVGARQ